MKNYSSFLISLSIACILTSASAFGQLPNVFSVKDHLNYDGDPGNVTLSITLGNNGSSDFLGGLSGIYLSLDTILNPTEDSLILTFSSPAVTTGDTANFTVTIPFCSLVILQLFPAYALDGNPFYVLYQLDYTNLTEESNENDNIGIFEPSLTMGCTTGIYETKAKQFKVYPNPTNGFFTVTFPPSLNNDSWITLQNVITQSTFSFEVLENATQKSVDCSFLPEGIYLLKFLSGGQYYQRKIVIER